MRFPLALLTPLTLATAAPAADPGLASKARQVLQTHCHRCHGQGGAVEGGFNYVLDLGKLAARKKVVPGNPDSSPLLRRVRSGSMPPVGEPRPTPDEVAVLREWIAAGAADSSAPARSAAPADVPALILADLDTIDRRARRFQRYFTLTHLAAAGLSADELQTYRNALSKLVNSLSWHPKVRAPEPIDPGKTVLRIDLRWYLWDAALWNRILVEYPYAVLDDTAVGRVVAVNCGTKVPAVRADWFVAAAGRAPLYYDLLQLPGNLAELERQIRVDAAVNIQQERVVRVGFHGSGVSRNNRVLERHDSAHGAYWRTYDFDEPPQPDGGNPLTDRRNVFAHPLGPGLAAEPFTHAGGEAIFTLPNGLHGYYLANAANDRLNKGPQAIVSDPRRPDRAVEAGVSCMSCHVSGILPKADQVRDHLEKNPKAFPRAVADSVRAVYPPKDQSLAAMEEDAKAYAEAVARTGSKVTKTEPVSAVTLRYEADLDLPAAAAEVGLSSDELRRGIDGSAGLAKPLGALLVPGGTVTRTIWLGSVADVIRELRLGTPIQVTATGPLSADNTSDADPLSDPTAAANAVAITRDGRRALVAGAAGGLRVRDLEAGRDGRPLAGHAGAVGAVAVSPDGRRGLSGGADGTLRHWDLGAGQELRRLDGHAGLVSAVAFSADGSKAVSGEYDGVVVWWDLATGRELRRAEVGGAVHALDAHPTRELVAVAADRAVTLWDPTAGTAVRRWEAHDRATACVRFAEGGSVLLTGGDDRRVRVWETATGARLADLGGHEGGVRGVELRPGGRWLLSASADRTVRLWDLTAKKPAAVFRKHTRGALAVVFLPGGHTLSVDRDLNVLSWDVNRFLSGSAAPEPIRRPPDVIPPAQDEVGVTSRRRRPGRRPPRSAGRGPRSRSRTSRTAG